MSLFPPTANAILYPDQLARRLGNLKNVLAVHHIERLKGFVQRAAQKGTKLFTNKGKYFCSFIHHFVYTPFNFFSGSYPTSLYTRKEVIFTEKYQEKFVSRRKFLSKRRGTRKVICFQKQCGNI